MTEETFIQRIERLVEEKNIPALLAETQQLLVIYLNGDDDIDLEPIVSAQSLLQQILCLFLPQTQGAVIDWEKQFPIAGINRADLTEFGLTDEQIATLFTDEVMGKIAEEMQGAYHMKQPFWEDFRRAITIMLIANPLSLQDVQTTGKEQ